MAAQRDVYTKLAKHLDSLPAGFPSTDSGVELRILRRLFSPEEAELATHLTVIPEEARVVARRAGMPTGEVAGRLDAMAVKGLCFNVEIPGRPSLYMASQYVIGIWEYHVKDLDPELIRDMREYIPTLFKAETWQKAPQLRTIPVGRSLSAAPEVLPYENAEELVKKQKHILVAPCICRREHEMLGEGCDKPQETCMVFGAGAFYYERNGLGRRISVEECLDILKQADKAGLVLQPSNSQKVINICCCCGCCCQVLKTMATYPKPAELVSSAFLAELDTDSCSGCGVCVKRCQMDALTMDPETEKAVLNLDRCIGCGLCVNTCPTKSLSLTRKPPEAQPSVPPNIVQANLRMARARGKMGPTQTAWLGLKSKMDRLLAKS
jgi:ferredoxin